MQINLLTHIIKYLIQRIWCFCFCQYNLLDWRLVGLWRNHVLYWPLTGFMWRNRTPFGKRVVNRYGSVCYYYRFFSHGTLHMWARIDDDNCIVFVLKFGNSLDNFQIISGKLCGINMIYYNFCTWWKKGSKQIWISVLLLSIFFPWNFTHVSKNRWGT
jgi:hypothetical protein